MRILFSCLPGFGHFHPLVPLARAAAGSGHEVAFATAERFCRRVVEPAGFTAFPAGLSPPEVQARTTGQAGPDSGATAGFGVRMFAGVAGPAKVADLVGVIDAWGPAVMVHDAIDFGAPVAAAHCGMPWAGHSFGALQAEEFWAGAARVVEPTWREWGIEPDGRGGMFRYLYLDVCPPGLQDPHIATVAVAHPLRPVPFDTPQGEGLPRWVFTLAPLPTVYVTLGTIFNTTPGVLETVLEGLRGAPLNVIVTVGNDRDPADLGPQPPNVHVERWIPQSLLFPRCDVVVCHGGSGTTLAALSNGLPLLLLPQGANQSSNAERCVAAGAAARLDGDINAADVRRRVQDLIEQPDFRAGAARLRREIEGMPAPADAIPLLESLARHGRPLVAPGLMSLAGADGADSVGAGDVGT